MTEKKAYRTTELAGYFVAGQRVPSVQDGDGNRAPKVGHILYLTDAEAKYEQGIEKADEPIVAAPLSPGKGASKTVEA
ncbi:hypothetical protein SAMN05428997_1545 [Bosea sp. CRIB-10]|uniref:hypothetical protein n=1 Tax=Bosea sp. CRIB-10 TaxID=378404 RepID=UPI0008E42B9D|nr:hypothetical protein [Bosea sp. CRIB-10]SFD76728.1 hypothetical protein SAMN05428997_1545 [Bosea sp. CRIB-10]